MKEDTDWTTAAFDLRPFPQTMTDLKVGELSLCHKNDTIKKVDPGPLTAELTDV